MSTGLGYNAKMDPKFSVDPLDPYPIYCDERFVRRYSGVLGDIESLGFYERRAALELLGPVKGLNVLDAGCGPGVYSRWLLAQGARVTALDYSPAMLARLRSHRHLRRVAADLSGPLPLEDGSFDRILCAMVLQHLRDWAPVLREFRRLLRPQGQIVLSTTHPFADLAPEADYFAVAGLLEDWPDYGVQMPCWRRSLARIFADVAAAGLLVESLSEPRAPSGDPFVCNQPWVLCLRLRASE